MRLWAGGHAAALCADVVSVLMSVSPPLQLSEDEDGDGGERVRLTTLYQFARSVRALLHTYHYNQIFLSEFWGAFGKYTGREFSPQAYGYKTLEELLAAVPQVQHIYSLLCHAILWLSPDQIFFVFVQVVWIKGHGHKKIIVLKNDMKGNKTVFPGLALGSECVSETLENLLIWQNGADLVFCPLARGSPVLTGEKNPCPEEENRAVDSPASGTTLHFPQVKSWRRTRKPNTVPLSLSLF